MRTKPGVWHSRHSINTSSCCYCCVRHTDNAQWTEISFCSGELGPSRDVGAPPPPFLCPSLPTSWSLCSAPCLTHMTWALQETQLDWSAVPTTGTTVHPPVCLLVHPVLEEAEDFQWLGEAEGGDGLRPSCWLEEAPPPPRSVEMKRAVP